MIETVCFAAVIVAAYILGIVVGMNTEASEHTSRKGAKRL
jgi:hypothetical protein